MDISKVFWSILLVLFVIFISIFIASSSGYYEYENRNKMKLTEEKMKQFEQDVADGKSVDLKNYLETEEKDYENNVTVIGDKMSNLVNEGITKGLEGSFKIIEKLIN